MIAVRRVFAIVLVALIVSIAAAETPSAAKSPLPWLGLKFRWIRDSNGARIQHVERVPSNGPAAHAGLRSGDLILTIDRRPVGFGDDLEFLLYLSERKPGERLRFGIVREGHPLDLVLTIGTMPDASRPAWNAALAQARQKRMAAARK